MPGNDAFQPLTEADFAVMQERGKVTFSPGLRRELNGELELLCSPEGDRFVYGEAKAAAELRSRVARDAGNLLATLRKLEAATEPGARLAAWVLFPLERRSDPHVVPEEIPEDMRLLSPLIAKLKTFCRWAQYQADKLPDVAGGRGRPAGLWLESIIVLVADAFEEAGGKVSVARQSTEADDGKRRRNTPFLRVLFYIHERLPAHRRASSNEALAEQAERLLTVLKEQPKPNRKGQDRKRPSRSKNRR